MSRKLPDIETHTVHDVRLTIRTYANGFGLWRARVDFVDSPGPVWCRHYVHYVRRLARDAIKRELLERGECSTDWRCRVLILDNEETHLGTMRSLTFGEETGR